MCIKITKICKEGGATSQKSMQITPWPNMQIINPHPQPRPSFAGGHMIGKYVYVKSKRFYTWTTNPLRNTSRQGGTFLLELRQYCQELEIDQLLQFYVHNFIFLLFALVFKGKIFNQNMPLLEGVHLKV